MESEDVVNSKEKCYMCEMENCLLDKCDHFDLDYHKVLLIKGNCIDAMKSLSNLDIKADAIITDPPYGTTQCKWDEVIPLEIMWKGIKSIIHERTPILLHGAEPFSSKLRLSNIEMFKYDWVWDKIKGTGFLNAKKQPMRNHEFVSVFYKKQCYYNPQKTKGHNKKQSYRSSKHQADVYGYMKNNYNYSSTERYPRSIQVFSTDTQNSSLHPTQKPLELIKYFIKTYTKENDLVIDLTMGSGTTGVACKELNRRFIGIEIGKDMFEVAKKRIYSHAVQQRLI